MSAVTVTEYAKGDRVAINGRPATVVIDSASEMGFPEATIIYIRFDRGVYYGATRDELAPHRDSTITVSNLMSHLVIGIQDVIDGLPETEWAEKVIELRAQGKLDHLYSLAANVFWTKEEVDSNIRLGSRTA